MHSRVSQLVEKLELLPHPEGGFYKETYRSEGVIPSHALADEFEGQRNYCTGIYFLLSSGNFSAFHRIKQDEMWHFYEGSPLLIHMIGEKGNYSAQYLGLNLDKGELPQFVVPRGVWFASEVIQEDAYALAGCTVSPGFDFEDFELATRTTLIDKYPEHSSIITKLTRISSK